MKHHSDGLQAINFCGQYPLANLNNIGSELISSHRVEKLGTT